MVDEVTSPLRRRIRELMAEGLDEDEAREQAAQEEQGQGGGGGRLDLSSLLPSLQQPAQQTSPKLRLFEAAARIGEGLLGERAAHKTAKKQAANAALANVTAGLGRPTGVAPVVPERNRAGTLLGGLRGLSEAVRANRQEENVLGVENKERDLKLGKFLLDVEEENRRRDPTQDPASESEFDNRFGSLGASLRDQNVPFEQVAEQVRNSDVYKTAVQERSDLGDEFIARAEEEWRSRDTDLASEQRAGGREERAQTEEERRRNQFETSVERDWLEGFGNRLEGQARNAGVRNMGSTLFEDPKAFDRQYRKELDRLSVGGLENALGKYELAAAQYWESRIEKEEEKRERERKQVGTAIAAEKETFDRMEGLRKSLQSLPGVKAFSGTQGIGGAFARMDNLYQTYAADRDAPGARGAFQNAIVQNFQRMIDPATVRLGDIQLIVDSQSAWQRFSTAIQRVVSGGFVDDDLLDQMYIVAQRLHSGQRAFVEQEVSGAINVWNTIHQSNKIGPDEMQVIAQTILGGDREEESEKSLAEQLKEARGG